MTKSKTEANTAGAGFQLVAGFDRTLIRRKGESVRFLVAEVTAPVMEQQAKAKRVPLNLALAIDVSGSMQGAPIEAAKEAALQLARNLGADDVLSVVAFDSRVTVHLDGRRQDATGRAAAAAAISELAAGSSTDLGGGWLQACACVARIMEESPRLRNRVVVLSDGQANLGIMEPDELARHAAELRARGLFSSAVGIGESYSDTQLEAIAASGGGRLHHASEPKEIVELVLGELEELRATVVESCDLVVETPAGFHAELVGDYAERRETLPGARGREGRRSERLVCVVGSLLSGASRSVVVKVTCGAGELGSEAVVKVAARYQTVGTVGLVGAVGTGATPGTPEIAGQGAAESVETEPVSCVLEFATGKACLAQPRDRARAATAARMWQLAVVRDATLLNQEGELERAAELVDRELRYFLRYCEGLPGAAMMVTALQRLKRSVGVDCYSPASVKEMRVSSFKEMRGEAEYRPFARVSWSEHLPK